MRASLAFVALALCASAATAQQTGTRPESQEQGGAPTNLQVLPKNLSRTQVMAAMRRFSGALGVTCDYCHARREGASGPNALDHASDAKPEKLRAREMIVMTRRINEELLPAALHNQGSGLNVQCVTCHRGVPRPVMLEDSLRTVITAHGADSAVAVYERMRQRYANRMAYDFGERTLSELGNRLAQENRLVEARRMLALNAANYPTSANAAFELGRVLEQLNEKDAAIAAYRKALELDPNHRQAQGRLRGIQ